MDLGRTDLDLFSVHAQHGTIRSDYCGALVITARPAETIGADRIGFGNLTYYWMQVWMQVGPPTRACAAFRSGRSRGERAHSLAPTLAMISISFSSSGTSC
ncbi:MULTISPECIES: hypothetical protein [Methylobacterium]|uniref:hypothetical protein n=1 Tax=Methylobacterium TaxID=407 RepID=UPI00082EC006|nr:MULTISPECIES: hypothetical protein [Methylobacterium]